MSAKQWADVAKGGALAHWTFGPPMFVVGVATGHTALIVLGPICFLTGLGILWHEEREARKARMR